MKTKRKCPAENAFLQAFLDVSAAAMKEDLAKHAAVCPRCLRKFNVLIELEAELKVREKRIEDNSLSRKEMNALEKMARQRLRGLTGRQTRPFFKSGVSVGIALGVSLVLAILGYLHMKRDPSPQLVLRGVPSQDLQLIKPRGALKGAPEVFAWTEVKGREAFIFTLVDEELNTVYRAKLSAPRAHLPAEVKDSLVKGRTYLWTVEAQDKECGVLASDYLAFEIEE
ncbi:MAG: hypothetical protein QHH14_07895 [Clostridiales bacterium]|nr:hypothetical protein [Clostridiales bacterium]